MATDKISDAEIKSKLKFYKTAWSDTYNSYIEIVKLREDDRGEPIIHGRVPGRDSHVLFRICELSQFCL